MWRKVDERMWAGLDAAGFVILTVKVAVAGKNILHIKTLAVRIALGLLHTCERVFTLPLGFQHCHRQGLGHIAHLYTQQVIGAPTTVAAAAFRPGGLYRGRRFQPDALRVVVAFLAQHRVNQMKARFVFIECHGFPAPVMTKL